METNKRQTALMNQTFKTKWDENKNNKTWKYNMVFRSCLPFNN